MELVSATVLRPIVPCLVGETGNPIAEVRIETRGSRDPLVVTELNVELHGTSELGDLTAVEIVDSDGTRLGDAQPAQATLNFPGALALHEGVNTLQIRCTLTASANLDHLVRASCSRVQLANAGGSFQVEPSEPESTAADTAQRLAIAVRRAGDDGCKVYRIPGLVTTPVGTLIAVYDVRWNGWGDLPGNIDVGMSRSTDGGRSWEPMQIILDQGSDEAFAFDGVGDPSVLVDRATGCIWVAAVWSHGKRGWHGSGAGLEPEETGQLLLVKSEDDGRSWSQPINITKTVKRPEWCFLLQGPGRGISMRDGTLVFPAQYQDAAELKRRPHATLLTSTDHGESWRVGNSAAPDTTEAQVVELTDGLLMLNARDNRGGSRSVFTTRDLGETWQEHPSSRQALIEPVCNAGLIRANDNVLLFCNPAVAKPPRRRMTLKASTDLGATWPKTRALLLDEEQSAGYSSLTMIDPETVGVLYESSRAQLLFQRIPLSALLER